MDVLHKLTVADYYNLKKMLLATDEDKSICIENLKNLNPDPFYIAMLGKKGCKMESRKMFMDHFKDLFDTHPWNSINKVINQRWGDPVTVIDLSWERLYAIVKSNYADDSDVKGLFTKEFEAELTTEIMQNTTWSFVESISCKIKW